jgi:hypothetical protein
LLGTASWSPSSDLYSLGALLVRGITGEHHLMVADDAGVTDKSSANVINAVREIVANEVYGSAALKALLDDLLTSEPDERPQHAEAVATRLTQIRLGLGAARHARARRPAPAAPNITAFPNFKDAPFRVGESPFKIKGSAYQDTLKRYDDFVPGGSARVLASVPAALAQFARGPFHAREWFDVFPMVYTDAVAARIADLDLFAFAQKLGASRAQTDMGGAHQAVIKSLSPRHAIDQIFSFSALQLNFVEGAEVRSMPSNGARLSYVGVPSPLGPWSAAGTGHYISACVALGGAKNVQFAIESITPAAIADGIETCRITLRFSWEPKSCRD